MNKHLKNGKKMRKSNINEEVLTMEQCKELDEIGLDMSDATVYWIKEVYENNWYVEGQDGTITKGECCIPTYTLQTMLSKLKIFMLTPSINGGYNLSWLDRIEMPRKRHDTWDETMIGCAFKMIKWCKENGVEL